LAALTGAVTTYAPAVELQEFLGLVELAQGQIRPSREVAEAQVFAPELGPRVPGGLILRPQSEPAKMASTRSPPTAPLARLLVQTLNARPAQ